MDNEIKVKIETNTGGFGYRVSVCPDRTLKTISEDEFNKRWHHFASQIYPKAKAIACWYPEYTHRAPDDPSFYIFCNTEDNATELNEIATELCGQPVYGTVAVDSPSLDGFSAEGADRMIDDIIGMLKDGEEKKITRKEEGYDNTEKKYAIIVGYSNDGKFSISVAAYSSVESSFKGCKIRHSYRLGEMTGARNVVMLTDSYEYSNWRGTGFPPFNELATLMLGYDQEYVFGRVALVKCFSGGLAHKDELELFTEAEVEEIAMYLRNRLCFHSSFDESEFWPSKFRV